jgi:hypothetical protein
MIRHFAGNMEAAVKDREVSRNRDPLFIPIDVPKKWTATLRSTNLMKGWRIGARQLTAITDT